MVHDGTVTAGVFKRFLQRLLVAAKQPIYLIVDGPPTHKAKLVRRYVESTEGNLKLFLLPPYAPHLNTDEQVWFQVKREVSTRGVQTKAPHKRLAIGALRRIQRLPALVRSFFQQPEYRHIIS